MASTTSPTQSSEPPTNPSSTLPRQPTDFSSLPLELRQKIWLLTFTPRLLCLHIQRRLIPPVVNERGELLDAYRPTLAISFTSTLCTPSLDPKAAYEKFAARFPIPGQATSTGTMGFGPISHGPVALRVCSESREFARKRYELAFGGTAMFEMGEMERSYLKDPVDDKGEWERRGLDEKRIWVDFKRDIIVVDGLDRDGGFYSKCARMETTRLLRRYAPEESSKITRLGIGGEPRSIEQVIKQVREFEVDLDTLQRIAEERDSEVEEREFLKGFGSLRELVLDHSFGDRERWVKMVIWRRKKAIIIRSRGRTSAGPLPAIPAIPAEGKEVVLSDIDELTMALRNARREVEGEEVLPDIKVVWGSQWSDYVESLS